MEGLGIDATWFLFQLGNFIVLFFGLSYLLHKPISKLLNDRQQEIKESLENAANIREELATNRKRQDDLLEQTRKQGAALLHETKERAKQIEEQLLSEARSKADKLAEQNQKDLANEREQLRSELKSELADMVVTATEKILGEHVTSTDKQRDIKAKIDSLTK